MKKKTVVETASEANSAFILQSASPSPRAETDDDTRSVQAAADSVNRGRDSNLNAVGFCLE